MLIASAKNLEHLWTHPTQLDRGMRRNKAMAVPAVATRTQLHSVSDRGIEMAKTGPLGNLANRSCRHPRNFREPAGTLRYDPFPPLPLDAVGETAGMTEFKR